MTIQKAEERLDIRLDDVKTVPIHMLVGQRLDIDKNMIGCLNGPRDSQPDYKGYQSVLVTLQSR